MFVLKRVYQIHPCGVKTRLLCTKTRRKLIDNQELFPDKLLTKKHKTPPHFYLINEEVADQINQAVEPFLKQSTCQTALEVNPGIGVFTKKLLDRDDKFHKILLMETMEHFLPHLNELHSLYPERVKVKHADFVEMWKLVFQDKMDGGTRVVELLQDVPRTDFKDEPNMQIFGAVGSYNFFKSLINSLVFQNGLFDYGRSEMFLLLPPPIYIHLTCDQDIGYLIYRSTSILFQMMFEYRFITQVPRNNFLPFQTEYQMSKSSRLSRVKSINPEYLYLVKIVPRKNLYELCGAEDLPALWYFVKQNCISRRNRIIPNMEKWAPGCGPRLIVNLEEGESVRRLYADENEEALPQFSKPCTTMTNKDFYPNMNIFTQFGELSVSQMLTLFIQFRQWPEFKESAFLASLENTLLKMETSAEDCIDNIVEEDDASHETVLDEQVGAETEAEKRPGPKRKNETQIT